MKRNKNNDLQIKCSSKDWQIFRKVSLAMDDADVGILYTAAQHDPYYDVVVDIIKCTEDSRVMSFWAMFTPEPKGPGTYSAEDMGYVMIPENLMENYFAIEEYSPTNYEPTFEIEHKWITEEEWETYKWIITSWVYEYNFRMEE